MPLYFQTDIALNDIYMNDRVFFSYPEAEDTMGGPQIIRELRVNTKRLPIRICSSFISLDERYGRSYTGMWEDHQRDSKLNLFRDDLDSLKNKLDRGVLVCFYIAEWIEALRKLEKLAPVIHNTISQETGRLFDLYPPRSIKNL